MLIPLGILASAGGGGAAMELISTVNGTGASTTITFSSIPATYSHLQIRWTSRSSGAAQIAYFRINGSTSTHYTHWLQGDGTGASSTALGGQNSIWINGGITPSSGAASAHTAAIVNILDYANTNKVKTVRYFAGQQDAQAMVTVGSGILPTDTTTVSSLTIVSSAGNFTTSSRFSLYGIKA